ncbi:hypothetical protein F441_05695 [Phytophthora nicotianae CJ01A1]|uniref:FYVE-type domain-containing protein n=6 Tax=Phytophthora nicotianae TaxID=4792 RepID=W2QFX0_PHYN3|nr:hypothetical protein PPTG_10286 [Phytophthora nicotianae INRA-310]ETI50860.1 hypothetical protein F443_05687 [Phytophthora nicotianae P1569]ETK90733.1 hypothetical protein L915_05549 [Phytophthora nicotianae]ETP20616.1 hypothetical protein F441_05695 [Phytophthora nicotianae CJ01A1]ETP48545.1 hypothetical protein F442_05733 [Phytophthora nicotianae P10297]ETL44146.1 hypothetical protein L916_05489 [Phytophthora nicotianae]
MAQTPSSRFAFGHRLMSYLPTPTRPPQRSRRAEQPTVTLELPELDLYHDRAEKALTETITAYGQLNGDVDTKRWKSLRSKRGVRLFRGHPFVVGHTPLLCVGTLHARFDDLLEGLYCDNTQEMLFMNATTCPRLAESAVLTVVQKRARMEPYAFTGIKWTTIKLTMANNRDLCYFDKMGMVRQATGKRMAYHVMQSVELPEYPNKMAHQRAHISLCYVFEELEDDLVGVYMKGDIDVGTLSFFVTKAVSDVLLAFVNALECTRAKKLTLMMTAARLGVWQSSSSLKNCGVCKSSPSFFDSFTECAGCNKPVCKKCRFRETVLTRDTMPGHTKRADFCRHCFTKMNMLSTEQLRIKAREHDVPAEEDTQQVETNVIGSERSLMSFVLNISTQVKGLSNDSEVRASNLSSIGWASSSDEEGEEVDIDNESEGRDVLKSSRLKTTPMVIYEKPPANVTRRSRSSTTSTASSFTHEEDDSEQYQTSLMAKLQKMSQQVEETLLFTREQSEVARSVRERTRSNRLLQERSSISSSSSRL